MNMEERSDKLRAIMIGTAVGDALGLPAEGLSADTIYKLGWRNWKHRFMFGKGMVSDDTEHTFFVCQALIRNPDDVDAFKASMAWKLRWWLLSMPAGIGFGTLRAIIKLWLFVRLDKTGVWTAGNGPAMRSAIIGGYFADDIDKMMRYVKASTELTHTDPRALTGAAAVGYAASRAVICGKETRPDAKGFFEALRKLCDSQDQQWPKLVDMMEKSLCQGASVTEFACAMGQTNGISGYIYHTAPAAIYSFMRHYGDYKAAVTEILNCGGDTDTTAAITGALAGAAVGESGIEQQWINGIAEWPRSLSVMRKAASRLAGSNGQAEAVSYCWPCVIFRNVFMAIVIFGHIALRFCGVRIRRLLGV